MWRNYPTIIEERPEPISIEYRRLWAAVINQAEDDLRGVSYWQDKYSVYYRVLRRERAAAWFRSARTDCGSFNWICDTLNLEPDRIRQRVLNAGHIQSHAPAQALDARK